ncbi:hypothetical protein PR048_000757 [Dryococelus australis]|uniref:Uncharacterized protein n=1 Tax=Dryococelus australis TaxID=614101 RepID=A0ABQ9IFI1_9NEOP|nr:hypothetical protein PR048_000757 [Dryococelus australis]
MRQSASPVGRMGCYCPTHTQASPQWQENLCSSWLPMYRRWPKSRLRVTQLVMHAGTYGCGHPASFALFSAFETERRWSVKGDTATRIKSPIAAKRKALTRRAVFSSCCVYLWDFQRRPYYFIGGKCVGSWNAAGTHLWGAQNVHGVFELLLEVGVVQQSLEDHLAYQVVPGEAVEVVHRELQVPLPQVVVQHAATTRAHAILINNSSPTSRGAVGWCAGGMGHGRFWVRVLGRTYFHTIGTTLDKEWIQITLNIVHDLYLSTPHQIRAVVQAWLYQAPSDKARKGEGARRGEDECLTLTMSPSISESYLRAKCSLPQYSISPVPELSVDDWRTISFVYSSGCDTTPIARCTIVVATGKGMMGREGGRTTEIAASVFLPLFRDSVVKAAKFHGVQVTQAGLRGTRVVCGRGIFSLASGHQTANKGARCDPRFTHTRGREACVTHRNSRSLDGAALECKDGEMGVPRENPPAGGIVQNDTHMLKYGSEPAGDRARIIAVGALTEFVKRMGKSRVLETRASQLLNWREVR